MILVSKKSRFKKAKFTNSNKQETKITQIDEKKTSKNKFSTKNFYFDNLEKLLIIPLTILILSFGLIAYQIISTGEFVNKGVSLKGGISITLLTQDKVSVQEFESFLNQNFQGADYSVVAFSNQGEQQGLFIEITGAELEELTSKIRSEYKLTNTDYTLEQTGSVIGESFFSQTFKAMAVAFLLMGLVVFMYFGEDWKSKIIVTILTIINYFLIFSKTNIITTIMAIIITIVILYFYITKSIPSVAVILAALSTLVMTLATFNLLGLKLTTGGIAAFLMLIGYSVDTDILLTTRVMKNKEDSFEDKVISSIKTGTTMTFIAIVTVSIGYFFSQSEMLKQIMLILLIGLIFDLLNTWVQNVAILKIYLKHQDKKRGLQ